MKMIVAKHVDENQNSKGFVEITYRSQGGIHINNRPLRTEVEELDRVILKNVDEEIYVIPIEEFRRLFFSPNWRLMMSERPTHHELTYTSRVDGAFIFIIREDLLNNIIKCTCKIETDDGNTYSSDGEFTGKGGINNPFYEAQEWALSKLKELQLTYLENTHRTQMERKEKDSGFFIDKSAYFRDIEGVVRKCIRPKTMVQYITILPFFMPFPENSAITFEDDNNIVLSYVFSSVEDVENIRSGVLDEQPIPWTIVKTRVEMMYFTDQEIDEKNTDILSDIFDALLIGLNKVITSYMVTQKDTNVHHVSTRSVNYFSIYRVISIPLWDILREGQKIINPYINVKEEVLKEESLDRVMSFTQAVSSKLNPFITSEEMAVTSYRYNKQGRYREAIIYAQMSAESFLNNLFMHLLVSEGKTLSDAEAIRESLPGFIVMIKKEFHSRLGGKWDITDTNTDVGKWHKNTYSMRNDVVHRGYYPSDEEAQLAIKSSSELKIYIRSLIKARKKRYATLYSYLTV